MYQSRSGSRRNAYVLNGVRSEGRIWLLHMEVLFVGGEEVPTRTYFLLLLMYYAQVLALVGDQLDYGENICGAVLSIRFNEDILSVWNRNASDHQVGNL
jgi:hypothetical protein